MKREDFVFTIGYKDDEAIVDKRLKKKYRNHSTIELYNEGLLKPAAASAIYVLEMEAKPEDLEELLKRMHNDLGDSLDEAGLRKIYGISSNPGDLNKVLLV